MHGERLWDVEAVDPNGVFQLATKGPLIASLGSENGTTHPCRCDLCSVEMRLGEEAFFDAFCKQRATQIRADGVDILSVRFILDGMPAEQPAQGPKRAAPDPRTETNEKRF
jgi:hypothetical protein